jgi:YidC/Oxa1 family membrane protein insertase
MAILDPLVQLIGYLLSFFYALPPHNLGVAIILVTFTVMALLYPLTAKQARSMIAMQMVQPEIKRIQAKYKNDRAKLNEEMMKFYQENKINPLAGCLPLLVQMPIFFALYRLLQNPYKFIPTDSRLYEALCTNPATGQVVGENRCGSIDGLPIPQRFLGLNLSLQAADQVTTWAQVFAFGLVVMVMFTGYMQSRQAQKRTPTINKQMALITKVLPVFFGFISLQFPAGLVLYFFVSNLWRLGQQEVIFRRFGTATNPKHKSLQNPPTAEVVDADSREHPPDEVTPESPGSDDRALPPAVPTRRQSGKASTPPAAKPGRGSSNGAPPGKPLIGPSTGGGGLRGLFRPPPAAAGTPAPGTTTKPAAKPAPKRSTPASPSAPTARPGAAGRPTGKKKKKR